ncbi:MAG: DUF4194 domain-containing protein [Clostridium sp.]|nr:DUF4194 domain-containing protein [Clostridium sp.]
MELYNKLSSRDKEAFKKVCNKLLSICFICGKIESNKGDYYFILRNRDIINDYFSPLGFSLEINEEYRVIQLVNKLNHNRIKLTLWESIVLLVLRVLYEEKIREISMSGDIVVNISDIQEKITALKIRDRLIDKGILNNTLRTFKRLNIVTNLDRDLTSEDTRVIIYPTILMAIRVNDIKNVYDKINNYKKTGEENLDNEDTEED